MGERRRAVSAIMDPTAIHWQGDLTALPLGLLHKRTHVLAMCIASAVVRDLDPNAGTRVDVLAEFRAATEENDRRVFSGDWNHDGRGLWRGMSSD